MTPIAIIEALKNERATAGSGLTFTVTGVRHTEKHAVFGIEPKKGRRGSAVDESLEGSRVVWNSDSSGRGEVYVVAAEVGEIVVRFATGVLPAEGDDVRLYPRDFLTPLIGLWENAELQEKAFKTERRASTASVVPIRPLPTGFSDLRTRQVDAVNASLHLSGLLIGPPGTGKTYTVGAIVANILRRFPNARILLTGPTNVAVDTALLAADDWLNRLGLAEGRHSLKRIGAHLDTRKFAGRAHLLAPGLYEAAVKVALLESEEPAKTDLSAYIAWKESIQKARAALRTSFIEIALGARVVGVTAFSVFRHFSELRASGKWDFIVCDEASQVPTPAALMMGSLAPQILFAGDPNQLAPVVQSTDLSTQRVLGSTAFDVMAKATRVLLNEQSRMTLGVCDVVSHTFYGDELVVCKKAISDPTWKSERAPWFVDGREVPRVMFDDRAGPATWSTKYNGLIRFQSAKLVQKYAEALLGSYADASEILVLTPFRAQRALIRSFFSRDPLRAVRVSTVHRSQGTECSIVLFDPVDASGPFLNSASGKRLLNVALSRAKAHVLVFIDQADLNNRWLRQAQERSAMLWHKAGNFGRPFMLP